VASRGKKGKSKGGSGEVGPKSKMVAGLLALFLGAYGVHRFYLGYTGMGLAMLFTCGGCGIWALVEAIMIFTGSFNRDAQGRLLKE
jgi:TM2 domain-containing membrane protein YozV